jgi:hydrogenase/urease accessory protein HupE
MIRRVLGLLLMLAAVGGASAHELRPAYLELRETGPDLFRVTWKVPAIGEMRLGLYARLPDGCNTQGEVVRSIENNAYLERWTAHCDGGLKGKTLRIDGLNSTLTDVLARIGYRDGSVETVRVMASTPEFTIAGAQTPWEIAATYIRLGIDHILLGFDHLLFVLTLLLLRSEPRAVVKTVTAFTAAHSITLSGAALGYLSLPQRPVEFLIALSIVMVAAELAKSHAGEPRLSERAPWLVAFAFGLLHGFGFAGALQEIGLPQVDIPLALLAFNVGVEIGQLLFILAALAIWKWVFSRLPVSVPQARLAASYGVGGLAATWMLQRGFFP